MKRERMKQRKIRDQLREMLYSGQLSIKTLILKDNDISAMRRRFPNDFFREWNAGINSYLRGDWIAARDRLEKTSKMIPGWNDMPSQTILKYMEGFDFQSPEDWSGVRSLT